LNNLRVLIITDRVGSFCKNGSEIFCSSLIEKLADHIDIQIIAKAIDQNFKKKYKCFVIDEITAQDSGKLFNFLSQNITINEYDIVYNLGSLTFGSNVVLLFKILFNNFLLINHFQTLLECYSKFEGYDEEHQRQTGSTQREVARLAAVNIFSSLSEYQMAMSIGFDLYKSCISIVPNGIDKNHFDTIEADYGFLPTDHLDQNQKPVILFTSGRFSSFIKGADLVYRAFIELYNERNDIFLLSVSDTNRFEYLFQDIPKTAYKILEWLPREKYLQYLAASDIAILPSRYEAFNMIAIESLMLEVPVIANDIGGLQEIIFHNHNGLINEPGGGSFGLYNALHSMLSDIEKTKKMGIAGKKMVLKEYSIERVALLVEKAMQRGMAKNSGLYFYY